MMFQKLRRSAWLQIASRLLFYLFLLLVLFLFGHAPERGFRYWGL